MPLSGRIRAAVRAAWEVLWGRSEIQLRMARIERDWMAIEVEVSAMFDNVNALLARIAKRQRREEPPQTAPELAATPHGGTTKLDIRRRVRAAQGLTSRVVPPTSPDQEREA